MNGVIAIVLLVVNIPVYKFLYKLFFRNEDDFQESVRYTFTPNLYSLFKGEYFKDRMAEARLSFFVVCCVLVVMAQYFMIQAVIDWLMK